MAEGKNKNNENMTIDDLARLVQGGFDGINKQMRDGFNLVDEGLNGVESDTKYLRGWADVLDRRIDEIKQQLDKVVYRHELDALRKRVEKLEEMVRSVKQGG